MDGRREGQRFGTYGRQVALTSVLLVLVAASAAKGANYYYNNFDSQDIGSLPALWNVSPSWGSWAPGSIAASVQSAPGGGKALEVVWGTDWGSYEASSGNIWLTYTPVGLDIQKAVSHYEYDMWKVNWRVWQMSSGPGFYEAGGIYLNDWPELNHVMAIADDPFTGYRRLFDVPEATWIHVAVSFNSFTDVWSASISYPSGSGGATFSGTSVNGIDGEWWFGGWAFKSTMSADPTPPGGNYENAVYIDNFMLSFAAVPEIDPAGMGSVLALVTGALGLLERRRVQAG